MWLPGDPEFGSTPGLLRFLKLEEAIREAIARTEGLQGPHWDKVREILWSGEQDPEE